MQEIDRGLDGDDGTIFDREKEFKRRFTSETSNRKTKKQKIEFIISDSPPKEKLPIPKEQLTFVFPFD